MDGTFVTSEKPKAYDKDAVKSFVICDFVHGPDTDEINIELGRISLEAAHLKMMEYIAGLRATGLVVVKRTCGRPNCLACQDDHSHTWEYVSKSNAKRWIRLFSRH